MLTWGWVGVKGWNGIYPAQAEIGKAFTKSVDKRTFRWLSRPRSGRIETEKGGKLGFVRPIDRPFDRPRAGSGQAQPAFSARFRDFEKAMLRSVELVHRDVIH